MENVKKIKFVAVVYGLLWKWIGNEDHMVWEGASIEEGFNFYDVVAHVVGHR